MAERKNSEKRIASNNKWTNAHYDRVNLAIPKGRKDAIKAHADSQGESVNAFIGRAIQETIERDTHNGPQEATGDPQGVVPVSLYHDTLKAAQEAAEAAGEGLQQFIDRAVTTQAKRDKTSLQLGIDSATGGTLEKEA